MSLNLYWPKKEHTNILSSTFLLLYLLLVGLQVQWVELITLLFLDRLLSLVYYWPFFIDCFFPLLTYHSQSLLTTGNYCNAFDVLLIVYVCSRKTRITDLGEYIIYCLKMQLIIDLIQFLLFSLNTIYLRFNILLCVHQVSCFRKPHSTLLWALTLSK